MQNQGGVLLDSDEKVLFLPLNLLYSNSPGWQCSFFKCELICRAVYAQLGFGILFLLLDAVNIFPCCLLQGNCADSVFIFMPLVWHSI